MLYSSGTTGRPKGVKPPLSGMPLGSNLVIADLGAAMTGFGADTVYLSPAPFYHAAPCKWVAGGGRRGSDGGADGAVRSPRARCAAIDEHGVTHSQWVPTMFLRLLRLDDEVKARYALATHRAAIHAAAPCPPEIKRAMIDWWGPIMHEYYAGHRGDGHDALRLPRRGSLIRARSGGRSSATVRILDDDGAELPVGQEGQVYFESERPFEYHNDPAKTAAAYARPGVATLGDVGRLDDDGFLYLTDRRINMIITGGVNVYPQEVENLLVTHPAVFDVAVIGVPSEEWGEEVRAVVQLADGVAADAALEQELLAFCRAVPELDQVPAPGRLPRRHAAGADRQAAQAQAAQTSTAPPSSRRPAPP